MMVIDHGFLLLLLDQAKENPRLRQNYDLRNSAADQSQRSLNAMQPGTVVPIHRHTQYTESVFVLHGGLTEIFYNDQGVETERYELGVTYGSVGLQIPAGQWHTVVVKEPSVIFEAKDGAYVPSSPSDIMQL